MLNFKNVNIVFALLMLLFGFFYLSFFYSWFPILFLLWISITTIGSFHIRWNYFLKAKHHNLTTTKNEIALTFDDGPHPIYTIQVLDLLKKHQAKATFFCIGKNIEKHPEIVEKIIQEGHLVANHSYAHTNNYGFLSPQDIIDDITKTQNLLQTLTKKNNLLFRPPFGVTNPRIAKAVRKLNLVTIGWSIRSYDTIAKNANKVFKKVDKQIKKGAILLLHDTSVLSISVLEQLLHSLEERKIQSVTIEQLFKTKNNVS